ncbi:MAG: patatin-like phospholipase family protein [Acidimicrobiia bacterium]
MGDLYNAVFEGGGAKGIAYAGALQACEEAGVKFSSVAGSSAGAITATLVACGYSAREIAEMMPDALAAIAGVGRSFAMFGRPSLLNSRRLHDWLAEAIAQKVAPNATFRQVFDKTGIALYVVTLDLATRQPVVFSPTLTPDAPVAAAVVASSSIPVAFPPARMASGANVHRLVDGGTWANYPSFVFHDLDFIEHHGLTPPTVPTIGFILDSEHKTDTLDPSSLRPATTGTHSYDRGSSARELGLFGAIVSSRLFRWAASIIPLLFIVFAWAWLYYELWHGAPVIGRLPASLQDLALVTAVLMLSVASILAFAIALFTMRFGHAILDTGLLGVRAAMGVGPGVPYWVGTPGLDTGGDRHTAVRIEVPHELKTMTFSPRQPVAQAAFVKGYEATRSALGQLGHGTLQAAAPAGANKSTSALSKSFGQRLWAVPLWPIRLCRRAAPARAVAIVLLTSLAVGAAYQVVHRVAEEQYGIPIVRAGLVVTGCTAGLVYLLGTIKAAQATGGLTSWLSKLPEIVLIATIAVAGFTLLGTIGVFSENKAWKGTSIVSSLRLEWHETTVDRVTDETVVVVAPPGVADLLADNPQPVYDRDDQYIDQVNCDSGAATCLEFPATESNHRDGDKVWIAFGEGVGKDNVVFEGNYWSRGAADDLSGYLLVGFGALTLLSRSVRALQHRRWTTARAVA